MRRHSDEIVVTHSYAPDPDRAKVQATLELWAACIADKVRIGGPPEHSTPAVVHPSPAGKARRKTC